MLFNPPKGLVKREPKALETLVGHGSPEFRTSVVTSNRFSPILNVASTAPRLGSPHDKRYVKVLSNQHLSDASNSAGQTSFSGFFSTIALPPFKRVFEELGFGVKHFLKIIMGVCIVGGKGFLKRVP